MLANTVENIDESIIFTVSNLVKQAHTWVDLNVGLERIYKAKTRALILIRIDRIIELFKERKINRDTPEADMIALEEAFSLIGGIQEPFLIRQILLCLPDTIRCDIEKKHAKFETLQELCDPSYRSLFYGFEDSFRKI
ncbi:hypothetical protein BGX27_004119 [Mortierella sp. AM989]|nr:hypothetical protein BGX27_004119 [Mortierella sp. AM989]